MSIVAWNWCMKYDKFYDKQQFILFVLFFFFRILLADEIQDNFFVDTVATIYLQQHRMTLVIGFHKFWKNFLLMHATTTVQQHFNDWQHMNFRYMAAYCFVYFHFCAAKKQLSSVEKTKKKNTVAKFYGLSSIKTTLSENTESKIKSLKQNKFFVV